LILTELLRAFDKFLCVMSKLPMTSIERVLAERELSRARRMLRDLVEIYGSGHWRYYYKKSKFADEVRRAKQAVDYWLEACDRHTRA
jgi:hypothetical protein